jgi:hypothetical protein
VTDIYEGGWRRETEHAASDWSWRGHVTLNARNCPKFDGDTEIVYSEVSVYCWRTKVGTTD